MSLGLFTKDANGDVWFDIDCLAHPHPKHFVFNLNDDPKEGRVLILYTGYTFDPTKVGMNLIQQQHVSSGDFIQQLETHLAQCVQFWQEDERRWGFLRVVYHDSGEWVFNEVVWNAHNDLINGTSVDVAPSHTSPIGMNVNELYCIGVGEVHAQNDWLTTGVLPMEDRLRSALQAAYDNGALVQIPSVRRPAKLSDCILSFAAENQLLT